MAKIDNLYDFARADKAHLEKLLLEAFDGSGSQEITAEFFNRLRARAFQAIRSSAGSG